MTPLLTDLAKEVIVTCLVALFSWVLHWVTHIARDLNANFEKIRCLERRVVDLEDELWGNQNDNR